MKIIHTADWHLCDELGRNDRTEDLETRVERVAALCVEHDAELLLIAGDLFSEQASVPKMTAAFRHLHEAFLPFFERGGTILAITGNHDRDVRIDAFLTGMKLAVPVKSGAHLAGGRLYLANGPAVVVLPDRGGQRVQFVLVPYPFGSRFNVSAADFPTPEAANTRVQSIIANWIQKKSGEIDLTLPTVLMAHLHVVGHSPHAPYSKWDASKDHQFQFGDLNPMWSYVALGHIHLPQMLGGAAHVRYSGSLDRLDFGETHDEHGVLLLEILGANSVDPVRLPIPPTPFHTVELTDPTLDDIAALTEKYPDRETAIVRIFIKGMGEGASRDEITRQLKRTFPRYHEIRWCAEESTAAAPAQRYDSRAGFDSTVRTFLSDRLAGDADAAAVLALAETFLTESRTA